MRLGFSDDRLLFAGTLKVFVDLEGFLLEPTQKWMAEYALHLSMSFDGTPYKGIQKLPPGHSLRITREGHVLRQYHQLDGETTLRLKRSEDYVATYGEVLEQLGNRCAHFVPTRMENCTLRAASRKFEFRWPLLDVRLVQLFLSIPLEEKCANGVCRLLHKWAIDWVVPRTVVWKVG